MEGEYLLLLPLGNILTKQYENRMRRLKEFLLRECIIEKILASIYRKECAEGSLSSSPLFSNKLSCITQ